MHDVAVVGAGPAGGMTAWQLARRGLSVVVLERRRAVGAPVQCGETLSDFALSSNGLEAREEFVVRRVRGVRLLSPTGHHFEVVVPGFCIRREAFDRHLVALAEGEGVEVRTSTLVRAAARTPGGWRLDTSGGEVASRLLVLADGPASPLGASLGLGPQGRMAVAMLYRFAVAEAFRDDHLRFHCGARYAGGYAWCFDRGFELNVGVMSTQDPKPLLDLFCTRVGLDIRERRSMSRGIIPQGGCVERCAGPGVVMVGDAAGLTNPCSGGGVHAALTSARMAAGHLARAAELGTGGPLMELGSDSPLLAYQRELRASPFADPVLLEARGIMDDMTDRDWESLIGLGEGQDMSKVTPARVLARALARPRSLPTLLRIRRLLRALRIYSRYGW